MHVHTKTSREPHVECDVMKLSVLVFVPQPAILLTFASTSKSANTDNLDKNIISNLGYFDVPTCAKNYFNPM